MAVKLSSYYWFRNNYLVRALEDKWCMRSFFGKDLLPEDREALIFAVAVLDGLKGDSSWHEGEAVLGPNVVVFNVVVLKDATDDIVKATELLHGIFEIMKRYWVWMELYRQLGNCLEEMGVKPPDDIAEALQYVKRESMFRRNYSIEPMCWDSVRSQMHA